MSFHAAIANAEAARRVRTSGQPYAFTTTPAHDTPQPVSGSMFCTVPATAFELTRREQIALTEENGHGAAWKGQRAIVSRCSRARYPRS